MNKQEGKSEMQVLLSFLQEEGYIYYYRASDVSNELEDLFFIHPTSLQIWHAFPYVMLMDATYKTNKYKMPLLEIVGVSSTNSTFCIAFVFMHKEKEFNYTWALNCLKSVMDGCIFPQVIVTDRELALMKACKNVFPDTKHLLCKWHIYESIKRKCIQSLESLDSWNSFTTGWRSLVESQTEEAYTFNLALLETILQNYPGVLDYLNDVWLNSYKHMFVSVWTDKFLNFGNHTTNRFESQHSKLKLHLDTTQSDLWTCVTFIHNLVQTQLTSIKASFQQSKIIIRHRFNIPQFKQLWGFVSMHALDIIFNELEQCKGIGLICGCQLHTSYGLPCAHEQMNYINQEQHIPLDSIHRFWRKLDLSASIETQVDDDLCCDEEMQMLTQNFKSHSRARQYNILRKLREIIASSSTLLHEPIIQKTNRGRPSLKQKLFGDNRVEKPTEEPRRHTCSNTSKFGPTSMENHEPARYSVYSGQKNYSGSYISQFPYMFHLYINQVQDVRGDGNCGFRAIAACLGLHEDEWARIRYDLMDELNMHVTEYNDMFGSQDRFEIYNSLNFFCTDIAAPLKNWLLLPYAGILIASRYNVILHTLSNEACATHLPLWSTPPPLHEHVVIAIGLVNRNHFVRVILREGYPVPSIYP